MVTKRQLLDLYTLLDERVCLLEEELAKTKLDIAYNKLLDEPKKTKRGRGRPRKNA